LCKQYTVSSRAVYNEHCGGLWGLGARVPELLHRQKRVVLSLGLTVAMPGIHSNNWLQTDDDRVHKADMHW
jgi:hypothetical protein